MRYLLLVSAIALTPLNWGDKQFLSTTSYRCLADFKAGVLHKHDDHVLTEFPIKPGDEYRLMHRSSISQEVLLELENYGQPLEIDKTAIFGRTFTTETNSYFIRKVSADPTKFSHWSSCIATGYQTIGHLTCLWPTKTPKTVFAFNASTGRFARSVLGTWQDKDGNSSRGGYSSVFTYGSCTPYYD